MARLHPLLRRVRSLRHVGFVRKPQIAMVRKVLSAGQYRRRQFGNPPVDTIGTVLFTEFRLTGVLFTEKTAVAVPVARSRMWELRKAKEVQLIKNRKTAVAVAGRTKPAVAVALS